MKKVGYYLIVLSFITSALVCGFLWGRYYASDELHLSGVISSAVTEIETAPASTGQSQVSPIKKVNINTATADELGTLPGIGPTLAKHIIDYREQHGPFPSVEALTGVTGIGEGTLNSILKYITIGGVS